LIEQDGTSGNGAKLCLLTAKLAPSGELTITETNADLYKAVGRAIERLKTALLRKIERQRSARRCRESVRYPNAECTDPLEIKDRHPLKGRRFRSLIKTAISQRGPTSMNGSYKTKEIFHATGNLRNSSDTKSHPQNEWRSRKREARAY